MASALAALLAGPGTALAPDTCTRAVMGHAQEHSAQDLGHGRVAWEWVWTNQGVSHDFFVVECASGEGLRAFGQQVQFREDIPFDRRDDARRVIDSVATSQVFSFPWLNRALGQVNVEAEMVQLATEPCACAVFYPAAGALAPFEAEQ